MSAELSAKFIISSHNGKHTSLLHSSFETRKIDLPEGSFTHQYIYSASFDFLVVSYIMFNAGGHTLVLHSFYIANHHFRYKAGIFALVLKIPSIKRSSNNIDTWPKDNILAAGIGLATQHRAISITKLRIPGAGQAYSHRQVRYTIADMIIISPPILPMLHPNTMWAIAHYQFRNI